MSRKIIIIIANLFLLLLPLLAAWRVSAIEAPETGLRISEIKLGGGSEPKEFVELFNDSSATVDLNGLQLEYAKTSFNASFCNSPNWKSHASPSSAVTLKTLSGSLAPFSFVVVEMSLTDNTAGSLRLSTASETNFLAYDLVGWGEDSRCYVDSPAAIPPSGQVIKRTFDADGHLIMTDNPDNSTDFTVHNEPLPGNDQCLIEDCYQETEEPTPTVYPEAYITELLPDPASPKSDTEDEFIELYNPHDQPIVLDGYTLYAASASTTYKRVLQDLTLQPGEYRALYSQDTGLSLVNSSGYVWLVAPDETIVFETDWYPDDLNADQAWVMTETGWQVTDTSTPGAQNLISLITPDAAVEEDCPIGKSRNPETGRCRNNIIATAVQPCKPNQERSPTTNRCRNIIQARSKIAACKPGQVRNPDTNRCRNITTAKNTECKEGYQKNTETNRCRKVAAAKSTKPPDDNGASQNKINFAIILGVSSLLAGYAVYEYRQDIMNSFESLKQRIRRENKEVVQ